MNEHASTMRDQGQDSTGAKFHTQIALDRTMLAWIRTTVTMATFGFGMVGFFRSLEERNPTDRSAFTSGGN
ncbi:MAG: DUF202 domain-containing protein [Pyrinomonadaceae bacterium]|nr:DUF202 domain-containing protein [Pyrinomonadaceae bacterium]